MDSQQQPAGNSALSEFVTLSDWAASHAGPFFPNRSSLDWFIKRHRLELIQAGALIIGQGRAPSVVSVTEFPRAALTIFKRRSLEKATGETVPA